MSPSVLRIAPQAPVEIPLISMLQFVGQEHCVQAVTGTHGGAAQLVGVIVMVVGHPLPLVELTNVKALLPLQAKEPDWAYVAKIADPVAAVRVELPDPTVTDQSDWLSVSVHPAARRQKFPLNWDAETPLTINDQQVAMPVGHSAQPPGGMQHGWHGL